MNHFFKTAALGVTAFFVTLAFAKSGGKSADYFDEMDTDNDGKVTSAEHDAKAAARFATMDANGDGTVTAAEMDAFYAQKREAMGKPMGKRRGMAMTGDEKITDMDANGDGVLSQQEFTGAMRARFAQMDSDKSGYLTLGEMHSGRKMMKDKKSQ